MPLPASYVLATIRYGVPQRPLQLNVVWYRPDAIEPTADNFTDALTMAGELVSHFDNALAAVMTTETLLHGIQVAYHISGDVYVAGTSFTSLTGDEDVDTLPEYCACVIQKRTGTAGKSGRGRWYVGSVPETFADNSRLTGVAAPKYDTLADKFKTNVPCMGGNLVPMHYTKKFNTTYDILATSVDQNLGTMRRRLVRPLI